MFRASVFGIALARLALIRLLGIVLLGTLLPAMASAAEGESAVDVALTGVQPSGKLFGEVFANEASFKSRNRAVLRFSIDPRGNATVRTTLTLPPGRYAIALFQDAKGTGKLETNLFGVPVEPYGFSNDARGSMGPPGFDAAAFTVGPVTRTLSIKLR